MKPMEFYDWAVDAAATVSSEAGQRSVISRLYYGLHHEACCRFFTVNPDHQALPGQSRHTSLSSVYNQSSDPTCKAIGNLLRDLKTLRGIADYDLSNAFYRGQVYPMQTLMGFALIYGQDLVEQLNLFCPRAAEEGCNCPVVWQN